MLRFPLKGIKGPGVVYSSGRAQHKVVLLGLEGGGRTENVCKNEVDLEKEKKASPS